MILYDIKIEESTQQAEDISVCMARLKTGSSAEVVAKALRVLRKTLEKDEEDNTISECLIRNYLRNK